MASCCLKLHLVHSGLRDSLAQLRSSQLSFMKDNVFLLHCFILQEGGVIFSLINHKSFLSIIQAHKHSKARFGEFYFIACKLLLHIAHDCSVHSLKSSSLW